MPYIDGFLLPVPKRNLAAYRRMAQKAGRIWREHGALEYRECVADDREVKFGLPFARAVKLKRGETVCFSWIMYRSRAHHDRVNARAMRDPRLLKMMQGKAMPFDDRRMYVGVFRTMVNLHP